MYYYVQCTPSSCKSRLLCTVKGSHPNRRNTVMLFSRLHPPEYNIYPHLIHPPPLLSISSSPSSHCLQQQFLSNLSQIFLTQRKVEFEATWWGWRISSSDILKKKQKKYDLIRHSFPLNCPCHLYGSIYHRMHNWAPHRLVYSKVYVDRGNLFLF